MIVAGPNITVMLDEGKASLAIGCASRESSAVLSITKPLSFALTAASAVDLRILSRVISSQRRLDGSTMLSASPNRSGSLAANSCSHLYIQERDWRLGLYRLHTLVPLAKRCTVCLRQYPFVLVVCIAHPLVFVREYGGWGIHRKRHELLSVYFVSIW